jgi:hypothetical protein
MKEKYAIMLLFFEDKRIEKWNFDNNKRIPMPNSPQSNIFPELFDLVSSCVLVLVELVDSDKKNVQIIQSLRSEDRFSIGLYAKSVS